MIWSSFARSKKQKHTFFPPPCASLFSLDDITSFWQGRLYVIVSIVAYTVCHALSTGTVTHGLWRPDLQLPLLFVSSCLAYFHKDKHSHLFCFAFPWKWKKKKKHTKTKTGGGIVVVAERIEELVNALNRFQPKWQDFAC